MGVIIFDENGLYTKEKTIIPKETSIFAINLLFAFIFSDEYTLPYNYDISMRFDPILWDAKGKVIAHLHNVENGYEKLELISKISKVFHKNKKEFSL